MKADTTGTVLAIMARMFSKRVLAPLVVSPVLIFAWPAARAHACGGFFCSTSPVVQEGEHIIFAVDQDQKSVEAIVQITYSGPAMNFAWLLPLPSAPLKIDVATNRLFVLADQLTAPQFKLSVETKGQCTGFGYGPANHGGAYDASAASGDAGSAPGVNVLLQEQVGPYDSVVLQSNDAQAIRTWLVMNNYNVTDQTMEAVMPYIGVQGEVFLALKMSKSDALGTLQPIALTLGTQDACIPLRLTAIAAQSNMEVIASVLSNQGRAIPRNYLHFDLDFARLDWFAGSAGYRQLVLDAVREAGGAAFTTEYSGSPGIFAGQIYRPGEYDLTRISSTTNLADTLRALLDQFFQGRVEIRGILKKHITDTMLTGAGIDPASFWRCQTCYFDRLQSVAFDPGPLVQDIRDRILVPDQHDQGLFDKYSNLTRLFTLISPENMKVDPRFDFRTDLPDVSNVHHAREVIDCTGDAMHPTAEIILEDGTIIPIDPNTGLPKPANSSATQLPATMRIDQLAENRTVRDNRNVISQMTGRGPNPSASSSSECACTLPSTRRAGLSLLFVSALVLALRSRRRRHPA